MKRKLLFVAALVASALGFNANAQTDVIIETDMTNQFMNITDPGNWKAYGGGTGGTCKAEFAPEQEINNGQKKLLVENFQGNCNATGEILWTEIPGLTPGEYEIELYGAAAYTGGRDANMPSEFFKNDATAENPKETDTKIYLYASATTDDQVEIPAHKATNFSAIATATLNVKVGTDGKVTIGLKKDSKGTNWHVVQLKGVTATVNATQLLANLKQESADLLVNEAYSNVTGNEKTALETASAATPEAETPEAYKVVIDQLQAAITAFTAAKADYDVFAAAVAMASEYADLPYASEEKKTAFDEAIKAEPASAEEAKTAAADITKPLRQYVESNAMGEGVGAEDKSSLIQNRVNPTNVAGWTQTNVRVNEGEPYIDGEGNSPAKYFDADGSAWGSEAWEAYMEQKVTLPAGKYLFSVTARGADNLSVFKMSAADKEADIEHISSEGGVFGRGWNDASVEFQIPEEGEVTLRLDAAATTIHQWFSADRFRLVRLGDFEPFMLYTDLTDEMFHEWTATETEASIVKTAPKIDNYDNKIGSEVKNGGVIYGTSTVYYLDYAVLTDYDTMVLTLAEGSTAPRILFNRMIDNGPTVEINSTNDDKVSASEDGLTWTIDLNKVKAGSDGIAHLNVIKTPFGETSSTTITSIKLGKAVVEEPTLTVGEDGWATYVTPAYVQFGEDVTAYVVSEINGEYAKLVEITEAPANTPVIIEATEGDYPVIPVMDAEKPTLNLLKVAPVTESDASIYVLANLEEEVGFYLIDESLTLNSGTVYLPISGESAGVKFIGFGDGNDATAIKGVETPAVENGVYYNLAGQRVQAPTKGIYIVNGKKVLVK